MKLKYSDYRDESRNIGIYSNIDADYFNKFSRFGTALNASHALTGSREYLFFTKPDFHLFENSNPSLLNPELAGVAFFREMHDRYNVLLRQLQITAKGTTSPFINLLTNTANSSMDMTSLDTMEMETGETAYGESIKYRWMSVDTNHDFSIEFLDSKYLEVYHLCKIWEEYARLKSLGLITPPSDLFIQNKILHDQVCVYKFIVGEDGETLLYYAKDYGVYIKNVPRDVFSNFDSKDGLISLSISFNGEFTEDMDPSILVDFNELVAPYNKGSNIPLYNRTSKRVNGQFVNCPYIEYVPKSNTTNKYSYYKLKWR